MAGVTAGQGFEPQLLGPEPSVLPLDDPAPQGRIATPLARATARNGAVTPCSPAAGRGKNRQVEQERSSMEATNRMNELRRQIASGVYAPNPVAVAEALIVHWVDRRALLAEVREGVERVTRLEPGERFLATVAA